MNPLRKNRHSGVFLCVFLVKAAHKTLSDQQTMENKAALFLYYEAFKMLILFVWNPTRRFVLALIFGF